MVKKIVVTWLIPAKRQVPICQISKMSRNKKKKFQTKNWTDFKLKTNLQKKIKSVWNNRYLGTLCSRFPSDCRNLLVLQMKSVLKYLRYFILSFLVNFSVWYRFNFLSSYLTSDTDDSNVTTSSLGKIFMHYLYFFFNLRLIYHEK